MTEIETNQNVCMHMHTKVENGYEVCTDCGLIRDQAFSHQDTRAFDEEQAKNRLMRSAVLSKVGYRTTFASDKDVHGKTLTPKNKYKYARLSKIHRAATSTIERDMMMYCTTIPKICTQLSLSNVIKEDVESLFISVINRGFVRGRSLDGALAASILAIIRLNRIPITIDEILSAMHLSHRTRKLMMSIYKDIKFDNKKKIESQIVSIDEYIKKYGNKLNFPEIFIQKSYDLMSFIRKRGFALQGKDPSGIAIAIIYIISKLNDIRITQSKMADITNMTEVTIRARIKEIKRILSPILSKKGIEL